MTQITEIDRFVAAKNIVIPYKTLETANKEKADYVYMQLGNGHYVCIHGDNRYIITTKKSPDGVQVIGCSCAAWRYAHDQDGCKHVSAFMEFATLPTAKPSSAVMLDLLAEGWRKDAYGNLQPPAVTSDPDGEDNEGGDPTPDQAPKPEPVPEPGLGEKIYKLRCRHCDKLMEGTDLDEVQKQHREHIKTCPENPANKQKSNSPEIPDSSKLETQEEETTMEEEETKKTYTHPNGKEFESAEALLDYADKQEAEHEAAASSKQVPFKLAPMIKNLGAPRLSEVGGIRIGRKRKGGGAETFDHFIFTTPDKDPATGDFYRDDAMTELYGDDCREIPVRFLSDDITEIFTTFYAEYGAGGMKIRGDGENWIVTNPDGSKTYIEDPEGKHGFLDNPNIKPQGILTVLVDGQQSVGTVYRFRTTGRNSIYGMLASLALCAKIAKRAGGRIAFLPMTLVYRTKEVTPKGERYKKTIPVITCEYRGTIEDLQLRSSNAAQQVGTSDDTKMLATVYDTDMETLEAQEDVRAEFFPEAV